ncbi:FAD-dependent oxidoreductase [Mycolicibacterium vaccae]|uniref:FAD-binding monooxygenase n=1 Tax=Mycolicibacterium vaccae ATCC 25954 TaxID=1194972 RepID=K0VDL5_MYCVA|nr:FAD-dependent oxidoreductase [Mycolicibacterium vaccae]ANI40908.1 FAD-binding monooxygenase [Mycolicibacterium vaccae 95051]EJZ12918.1 FAD-binding monooxygenase [Mycolicibacterium vaccae ATCC 25954]MCV7062318.1 FAD-dependent monooxygenase [Mycolicibacterium vaccae]
MPAHTLVIGAGIAGLATAVALRGCGHDVTVIEQRTDIRSGAGISIWPNALAALDRIGLGDSVRQAGGQVAAGAIRWRDGSWLRRPYAERMVHALGEPLVVVRRSALTDILVGALPPGAVRTGTAAAALSIREASVRVTLSDGTTRDADAVVGADGVNSVVARTLNGPLPSRYVGYTAWRGVAAFPLDPELAGETIAAGTQVGHVPLGPEHTYWFATERTAEGGRAPGGEHAYLTSKFSGWAEPIPALLAATDPAQVLRNDLYDRAQPRRWSTGPAVIVGDAAHPMRPHLGQGGCQALEDAPILARFVELCPDLATAFDRFGAFRRRRVRPLVREAAAIGRVVNMRPTVLSGVAGRATAVIPEKVMTRHLASIAAGSAFVLPTAANAAG